MNPNDEARLMRLEELVAHQQAAIEDLSRQLTESWKTNQGLRRDFTRLTDRFDEIADATDAPEGNQKPPHW